MNKSFQKISSFILAGLVLLSTVSFTVEKHYCGRILVDIAIFSEAKGCGMETMDHNSDQNEMIKKSCCKDEIIVVEGQDDLKISLDKIDVPQQVFLVAFVSSYFDFFNLPDKNNVIFKKYSPPDLVVDFHVLHEVFLI
ncbi:hypothetical protein [Aquimarina sp. MMG016]|uniref:HYC_CC_PP family protein n=1 Tax=Aquimarina sp. MMG016 TaxID=2822690 RepID=UPI001B3A3C57|nr:hypothetical protein [Aquimarina sp. MMG016]MBQ4820803.1 hypothetical protein [Aquimarina sp. MMG016]